MILDKMRYRFLSRMRKSEGLAPRVPHQVDVKLGMHPTTLFEFSLSAALAAVILMFLFFPNIQQEKRVFIPPQEMVKFEDVEKTRQENRPPPPPRPPIPIESVSDEALEDVTIHSTELDLAEDIPPPPPQPSMDTGEEASYFVAVEEMPQLIGGLQSLMKNLVYPELAIRAGIHGRVFVMAYVNEQGEVVRAEVQKGIGGGCDEAAVAAVLKAKFTPGKQRGRPVKVKVSIPILFRLSSS